MAEIVLDRVGKRYARGVAALADVSITIHDGEFFILVGPSGCGKSTLLSMIVGLEKISEGEIRVDGVRINELDPRDRNMAMVFQSYALYPHMSVRDNLAFPLKLARVPTAEIQRRVDEIAETLVLTELLDRQPAKLSGGQRQRVAMGRAMVRRPKVFLMDEPLSNLDARLRVRMRGEIGRLQRQWGVTTIYVTHDQAEAMILGDRVAVLREGRLQQVGTPRDLYDRPANLFVAEFIGSPGMSFFPARVEGSRLLSPLGTCDQLSELELAGKAGPIIAGVRPEHVVIPDGETSGLRFRAWIDLAEWLGSELFLHVRLPLPEWARPAEPLRDGEEQAGTCLIVARVDAGLHLRPGDEIELAVLTPNLRCFDAVTGESLAGQAWPMPNPAIGGDRRPGGRGPAG